MPPKFALFLTCLFVAKMAQLTPLKESSLHVVSAYVGQNVSLLCLCQNNVAVMIYWYKQSLGQKPKLMSTHYKNTNNRSFSDEFKDSRFKLDTVDNKNTLNILNLQISDSATYYCVISNLYAFEFCEGITISVKGLGLTIQALVHQSSSETIQPGDSVNLSCTVHTGTCDGEHSVYWFKNSEESEPGLIYTHGNRTDQCERKPNTQTHTCVYNLPMKNLNLSHTGTYYCAVVSCGHILFGNGTKLDFEDDMASVDLVYLLSGALTFLSILVILLALSVHKMYKRTSHSTDCTEYVSALSTPNELGQDAENLHYAALRDQRVNRSRRQKDENMTECVYSRVRQ